MDFGSIAVTDKGKGNTIAGEPPLGSEATLSFEKLYNSGSHNTVTFGKAVRLNNLTIIFRGEHCRLVIGDGARLCGRITVSGRGSVCEIGAKTSAERFGVVCNEGRSVRIGEMCMISYQVELRNTDSHSIIDVASRQRINWAEDVTIGDHVWLGAHSLICKGVTIPKDVIVGQGAIVTKSVEQSNCVVAGNPARIVRTGVTWDNRLIEVERQAAE